MAWFLLKSIIVPADQNHSEHAPPSNPPLVDRNQTDADIPQTDQNETIEPLLPRVKLPSHYNDRSWSVQLVELQTMGDEVPSKFGFAVSQQIPSRKIIQMSTSMKLKDPGLSLR